MQGGACYEEVHELWQRVTKAEQAVSEATAELCTHKDAARHATLELKVRHRSQLVHLPSYLLPSSCLVVLKLCLWQFLKTALQLPSFLFCNFLKDNSGLYICPEGPSECMVLCAPPPPTCPFPGPPLATVKCG